MLWIGTVLHFERKRDRSRVVAKWALSPEKPEDGSTGKFLPTPFFRFPFAGLQDSNRRTRNVHFSSAIQGLFGDELKRNAADARRDRGVLMARRSLFVAER